MHRRQQRRQRTGRTHHRHPLRLVSTAHRHRHQACRPSTSQTHQQGHRAWPSQPPRLVHRACQRSRFLTLPPAHQPPGWRAPRPWPAPQVWLRHALPLLLLLHSLLFPWTSRAVRTRLRPWRGAWSRCTRNAAREAPLRTGARRPTEARPPRRVRAPPRPAPRLVRSHRVPGGHRGSVVRQSEVRQSGARQWVGYHSSRRHSPRRQRWRVARDSPRHEFSKRRR